jgi:outer membrane receptor protein involved in Fe transport
MESAFPERIQRDPVTNRIVYVDSRLINISKADISGVDLEASTAFTAWGGQFYPAISATYTYEYIDQVRPGLPLRNNLGVRTGSSWAPKWKIVPRLTWSYEDQVSVNAFARYISAYKDPAALTTGENAGEFNMLGDIWHIDASVDLSMGVILGTDRGWISNQRMQLGVRNLTNKLPEFCNSCGISGYDASQYDIIGRTISLTLRANF